MTKYLVNYIYIINVIGFLLMGYDKRQAIKGGWRIKETNLILFAALGGALGAYLAMKVFRHKTKHTLFKYGLPLLLVVNGVVYYFMWTFS